MGSQILQSSLFNRKGLCLKSLTEREHKIDTSIIAQIDKDKVPSIDNRVFAVAKRIIQAKRKEASIILMMGAHVIRSGVQKYLIDLMERGYISCIAMNGGGMIHDFELALIGATTEDVTRYIKEGQFGLWEETGHINDIINSAYKESSSIGMGEAVGREIEEGDFPHKDVSILAAGYRFNVPVTVHIGIGYDIIHEHPNCDGATTGALSYNDFLRFASIVRGLEGGVVMNFGSAVMGPEVFLKALSMARNVAHQKGEEIKHFFTVVCDLQPLPEDFTKEPSRDEPGYYFRPWKTMLIRTVADGGESLYIEGKHSDAIPALWSAINSCENEVIVSGHREINEL